VIDHIGKEMAAREIAKDFSKLSVDELRKIAAEYDVSIEDALDGEYFTKANLGDETESLTDLAKSSGNSAMIDVAKKLDALSNRMDAQDAERAELLAKFDKLENVSRDDRGFWKRHNERLK
jgi:uncharacterized protein YyaL (SSP411 family)